MYISQVVDIFSWWIKTSLIFCLEPFYGDFSDASNYQQTQGKEY